MVHSPGAYVSKCVHPTAKMCTPLISNTVPIYLYLTSNILLHVFIIICLVFPPSFVSFSSNTTCMDVIFFQSQTQHTILLVQPGKKPEGRTYSDYESISECLEGRF